MSHPRTAANCPRCGELTWAKIPEALRGRSISPRLAAVMALLSGAHRLSRRSIEALVETAFAVPVARAVLWRKNAFGSWSVEGCRFVERMLTVVQTLRLQQRPVLDYLPQALVAHRSHQPAPKLLPSG